MARFEYPVGQEEGQFRVLPHLRVMVAIAPKGLRVPHLLLDSPFGISVQVPLPFPQGEAPQKRLLPPLRLLSLLVDDCSYPSLDPLPEVLQMFLHVREQEVVYPAREQPQDAFAHFLGRSRVISFGEQAESGFQRGELLVRHASFGNQ